MSGVPPVVRWLIVLAVSIVAFMGGSVVWDEDEGTVTVKIPVPQQQLSGDLAAVDARSEGRATIQPADSELRDETPEGVPQETLRAAEDRVEGLAPLEPKPVGGAQNYEIRQDFA